MYTNKQRVELADICYMTVEKECNKPLEEVNADLIDAGLDLANKLLNIRHLTEEDIETAKKKVMFMTLRRRKRKVRIIAAVLAVLIILTTTACAFSDWLMGVFGIDNLYRVPPGYNVTVEQSELEAPNDILYFDTIEEVVEYVDESIYLPVDLHEEYVLSSIIVYEQEEKQIELLFEKDNNMIRYMITFNPSYFQEEQFETFQYKYYSKDNHPYDFVNISSCWQAMGWIDNNEYIISSINEETLKSIIDNTILVK